MTCHTRQPPGVITARKSSPPAERMSTIPKTIEMMSTVDESNRSTTKPMTTHAIPTQQEGPPVAADPVGDGGERGKQGVAHCGESPDRWAGLLL